MLPSQLKPDHFQRYPELARKLAVQRLSLLQELPLSFVPLLLREVITYDFKFPVERNELDNQFRYLASLSQEQRAKEMAPFAALRLSAALERVDWVNSPGEFSEQLTAHLWASHQIDSFRTASIDYVHALNVNAPRLQIPVSRLAVVLIGQGVGENKYPLFRKLRSQGTYFDNINPDGGVRTLLDFAAERSSRYPVPFGHWYVDGAQAQSTIANVTCVSYDALARVRGTLVEKMRQTMRSSGAGPELLRTLLAEMRPSDVGLSEADPVLSRFQLSLLTQGSGTQLFSTTFVQWSAREALRRAQPLTLIARFTPRQREQSMRELIEGRQPMPISDPQGSLVDADMGAYYTWINLQRLDGFEKASFVTWFEDHNQAVAIGPKLKQNTVDHGRLNLQQLVDHSV